MTYEELVEGAVRDPDSVDFTELRLAYARSPEYDPYRLGTAPASSHGQVRHALRVGDLAGLLVTLSGLIEKQFCDISAHRLAALAYERIGDRVTAARHRKIAQGLVASVLQSGDGRSSQTAYQVISVAEEYAVLEVLGLSLRGQKLIEVQDQHYDILTCAQGQTGEEVEIYFNVDLAYRGLEQCELLRGVAQAQDRRGLQPTTRKWRALGPTAKLRLVARLLYLAVLAVSLLLFLGGVLLKTAAMVEDTPFLHRAGNGLLLASGIALAVGFTLLILTVILRRF